MVGRPLPATRAQQRARVGGLEFRENAKGEWIMTLAVFKVSDPGAIWKRLMRGQYR